MDNIFRVAVPFLTLIINAILTGLVSILMKRMQDLYKETQKEKQLEEERQSILFQSVGAMIKDRLFHSCFNVLDRGVITVDERDAIIALYNSYHALGLNSTGTELYERAMDLKIVQEEKKK